jgi:hypothetical protein
MLRTIGAVSKKTSHSTVVATFSRSHKKWMQHLNRNCNIHIAYATFKPGVQHLKPRRHRWGHSLIRDGTPIEADDRSLESERKEDINNGRTAQRKAVRPLPHTAAVKNTEYYPLSPGGRWRWGGEGNTHLSLIHDHTAPCRYSSGSSA